MEKKVYENSIENAEKFLSNGMHKETDRNELVENVCSTAVLSSKTSKNKTSLAEESGEFIEEMYQGKFDIEEFLKLFSAICITENKYSFYRDALINYIGLCKYNLNIELLHNIKIESSCDKEDGTMNFTSSDYKEALEKLQSIDYLYAIKPERDTKIFISEKIPVTYLIQRRSKYTEEMLEFVKKFSRYEESYNQLHIIPLTFSPEDKKQLDIIKKENDITDDKVVLRLWKLRLSINEQKHTIMDYKGLIKFLKNAMNYDEMQIWIMKQQMIGKELTLSDMLEKFFELKSDEDIIRLYDMEQNYDQNNINNIRESLSSAPTERMSEEPTLSQLLNTSKNMSEEDIEYVKKLMRVKIES